VNPNPLNIVIATRESRLALWQAEHVQALLRARGHSVALLGMTTLGDQILDRSLSKVGGKGLFVKELETALEDGRADIAVHSLKDVPMELPPGFALACVMEREDARDAFVSPRHARLADLPEGAVVGTSSLRRTVLLQALRPDLRIEPLRGNLDTRLRKLDEGQYDAIVLAAAGLKRLGLGERIDHTPGQLSGGQQQRVAIARALVNEPELLLADEPTGNLDSRTSLEIMEVLQRLNRARGITIVLITHERDIAEYTQRVIAFRDGRVVSDEPVAQRRDAAAERAAQPAADET